MKRGQGLPLNTIVIAIIVLVVMGVLIAIFASKINVFAPQVSSCEQKGGVCKERCEPAKETILTGFDCKDKDKTTCCLSVL